MEHYKLLAECLLPEGMLDWFELKSVKVEMDGKTEVVHIYLDENDVKPEYPDELRPNGFTREGVFHDFPIRVHKVLIHVHRRRWLDLQNHNVMTECRLIQKAPYCSTELTDFLKGAYENAPCNGTFVRGRLSYRRWQF